MTRIRYIKNSEGHLITQMLLSFEKKQGYHVRLNPFLNEGEIVGEIKFKAKTLPALKKQAKKELEALGVVFKSEVRPRIKKVNK